MYDEQYISHFQETLRNRRELTNESLLEIKAQHFIFKFKFIKLLMIFL